MTVFEALPIALEFLGDALPQEFRWKPNTKCFGSMIHGTEWDGSPRCTGGHPWGDEHEVPCLRLTDALAMAMLRALATLTHAPELFTATKNDWHCVIFTDDDHVAVSHPDPAQAIVLAIAALSVNARRPS